MTQLTEFDEKIKELTEKIAKEPENAIYYSERGFCYLSLKSYEKAIEDFSKAIEIEPNNAMFYLERGVCYFFLKSYEKAIEDLNKVIELKPENADFYAYRGKCYSFLKSYEKAIENYNKAIEHNPNNADFYFDRADCYHFLESYEQVIKDCNKAIELDPENTNFYFARGNCYFYLNSYGTAIEEYNKAIELKPDYALFYASRGECYSALKSYEKAIEDFNKAIELDPNDIFFYADRGKCYLSLQYYEKAIEDADKAIQLDPKNEAHKDFKNQVFERKKKDEKIRLEERNKVIADLSHSIKNLIATVIDPLENLKNETVVQPQIIQNALRGANLIREIVNAVNLSFKGSMEDFIYDAQHNAAKDSVNLESMLIESLRQSVGNMFDGKYFGNFMRKYFPKKEHYHEAKAGWTSISQSKNLKSLEQFLKSYFFETDFSFENAKSFAIGNQKGSAVKLLILFQELILNAVKYSAFVSKEKRFLRISFISNADTISVKVENPFDENTKTKTTGIGHVVIQNFATLLNTEPVISKENSIYCVVIQFKNLWQGSAQ